MEYIKKVSKVPSFTQDGQNGFSSNINNENISIDIIEVYKGHEKYCTNKVSSHIYYVLEGNGKFKINGKLYDVEMGDIIEIPKNTEFIYIGKMKLLLIMSPAFQANNNVEGKNNDLYNQKYYN